MQTVTNRIPRWLIWVVVATILLAILLAVLRPFWYFEVIENDEVGVRIEAGKIVGVVQPGIAYDFGLFVQLIKIRPVPCPLQWTTPN